MTHPEVRALLRSARYYLHPQIINILNIYAKQNLVLDKFLMIISWLTIDNLKNLPQESCSCRSPFSDHNPHRYRRGQSLFHQRCAYRNP